jgi:hypothetical protein
MYYNLMMKNDDKFPVSTPRVKNEALADGLYRTACGELHAAIMSGDVKIGYVRQYCGSRLIKEYHAEQQLDPNQPVKEAKESVESF